MAICPIYNAREKTCPLDGDVSVNPCESYKGYCKVLIEEAEKDNERVRDILLREAELNLKSKLREV